MKKRKAGSSDKSSESEDVDDIQVKPFEELLKLDPKDVKSIRVLSNEESKLLHTPSASKKLQ